MGSPWSLCILFLIRQGGAHLFCGKDPDAFPPAGGAEDRGGGFYRSMGMGPVAVGMLLPAVAALFLLVVLTAAILMVVMMIRAHVYSSLQTYE